MNMHPLPAIHRAAPARPSRLPMIRSTASHIAMAHDADFSFACNWRRNDWISDLHGARRCGIEDL